ncbi:MAG TPA: DUF4190 domain-containing protein [Mycobacterium sp.]|uniref:DUF4190 domain-containing protein n=1 Tax=Mycolicibacterium sp. TaxID=2320850 RepID=UPI0026006A06|nr:DUF4190 domain-containing protein [Mycolicibacterium sp.]HPX37937.1 DUF4190 domain-containing protein [Mycobacterium sp.]HQC77961.1 DUF4190 domain-containing protein [Mycobacterium sp.]
MTQTPDWQGKPEATPVSAPPPGSAPYPYSYPPGPPSGPYTGGPYTGGYPPPPTSYGDYYPTPPVIRNGLGVAALVVAIIGLLGSFSVAGGVILGIVAVILGFLGRNRVRRGEANNGGVALAGIILGVLSIIAGLVFIAIWVGMFKEVGAGGYFDCLQQAGQDRTAVQECSDEFRQSVENQFSQTRTPVR